MENVNSIVIAKIPFAPLIISYAIILEIHSAWHKTQALKWKKICAGPTDPDTAMRML